MKFEDRSELDVWARVAAAEISASAGKIISRHAAVVSACETADMVVEEFRRRSADGYVPTWEIKNSEPESF